MTTFRSMDEIEKHFFPNNYEQEMTAKMTPEELGRYWAEKSIERIKKKLNYIF